MSHKVKKCVKIISLAVSLLYIFVNFVIYLVVVGAVLQLSRNGTCAS